MPEETTAPTRESVRVSVNGKQLDDLRRLLDDLCARAGVPWDEALRRQYPSACSLLANIECDLTEDADSADAWIAAARREYGSDDVEVDDDAAFSVGDDGVWVGGWLFLSNELLGVDDEDGEDEDDG